MPSRLTVWVWNLFLAYWCLCAGVALHECLHGASTLASDVVVGTDFRSGGFVITMGPWNGHPSIISGVFMYRDSQPGPFWMEHDHLWIYPLQWFFEVVSFLGLRWMPVTPSLAVRVKQARSQMSAVAA